MKNKCDDNRKIAAFLTAATPIISEFVIQVLKKAGCDVTLSVFSCYKNQSL